MQVKLCPNCSAENQPDSASCAKCNWNISNVQPSDSKTEQPAARPMPAAQPVSRGSGGLIVVIILIAVAAFAGWWFFLRGGGGPEATVNRFVSAIKAGDFEGMKSTLSKSSASMFSMMPGGEKQAMESMKKGSNDMDVTPVKTTFEGENAIVTVKASGGKMPASGGPEELVLIKEDGSWKIDLMATGMRQMKKFSEKMHQMPGGSMGR